jgi:hypothetical protein
MRYYFKNYPSAQLFMSSYIPGWNIRYYVHLSSNKKGGNKRMTAALPGVAATFARYLLGDYLGKFDQIIHSGPYGNKRGDP